MSSVVTLTRQHTALESLPPEAQAAFRMAYRGGAYWARGDERPREELLVGNHLVALVGSGRFAEATSVALAYHRDPAQVVAMVTRERGSDTVIASGSYEVASIGALLDVQGTGFDLHRLYEHSTTPQRIAGTVELNGRVMPVRMGVAAFDSAGNRVDVDPITKKPLTLTPSLPVWVVVHGMDSSEQSDPIVDVARTLQAYPGMQVVTVNWEDAAKDGIITQDARWTPPVGKWVAQQLVAAGFAPSHINIVGWSHGSYVAYSIAEEISRMTESQQQINALVALDPAGNWPLLSGYDHTVIDFKKFSRSAVAMEGSLFAGSDVLAGTADISFRINAPQTLAHQIMTEHSLPVTAFAALLEHERACPGTFSDYLSLQNIMDPKERKGGYQENSYRGAFEFVIDVGIREKNGARGPYPYATPEALRFKGPDGNEKVVPLDCHA